MRIHSKVPPQGPHRAQTDAKPDTLKNKARPGAREGSLPGVTTGRAAGKTGHLEADTFVSSTPDVQATFQKQFSALATDKERFHDTMRAIFGEDHDSAQAEQYRQRALAGDFKWMPPVKWVAPETLGGANGAYDAESGTVLLNRALDPSLAASTYVEEAGHHLDARLNAKDTPGDEGELFRRILGGEKLSAAQVAEIRAENDKGIIYVDGKAKEVEFWNPFKTVKKVAQAVGNTVTTVAQRVGDSVHSVTTGVLNSVLGGARNMGEALGTFYQGAGKVFTGRFGEGFKQMGQGMVKAFIQTPVDSLMMLGGRLISAVQTNIGLEPPGRKLKADEIATLQRVYGNSIDYSSVRIKEGKVGVFGIGGAASTQGNTIYIPRSMLPLKHSLLVHEMAHVWQHQNGGTDYMSEAIWAQEVGDAYDFEKGIREGKSWKELDPEQQAELLGAAQRNGFFDQTPPQTFIHHGKDYTSYLLAALEQVRAGRGAT